MSAPPNNSTTAPNRVPTTLIWLALVLGVAGLVTSSYLTYEHYTGSTTLACPESGRVNCARVTSSAFSKLGGIPVALLGTLYFAAFLLLLRPATWSMHDGWVRRARLGMAGLGVVMALYLVWAELYRVHAICLWCTAVHVVTFLLFVTVLFADAVREDERS